MEVHRRIHALVKHADDLQVVAAAAEDDQMLALVSAVKAGEKIVARLPRRMVDRQSFEPRHQDIHIRRRLGLAPRFQSVFVDVRQVGFHRRREDDFHPVFARAAQVLLTRSAKASRPASS